MDREGCREMGEMGRTKGDIGVLVPHGITVLLDTRQPRLSGPVEVGRIPVQRTCRQIDHVWGHWGLFHRVSMLFILTPQIYI